MLVNGATPEQAWLKRHYGYLQLVNLSGFGRKFPWQLRNSCVDGHFLLPECVIGLHSPAVIITPRRGSQEIFNGSRDQSRAQLLTSLVRLALSSESTV
jgi:hypothetical protein